MRLALASLVLLCAACVAPATAVEIVRVWPGWRSAESFERITDFFGEGPPANRPGVVRTHPDVRDGYYFAVRVKQVQAIPAGSRFELGVIRPDTPETLSFQFPVDLKRNEAVVHLGLTGADWPGGEVTHPVAWRLALVDRDGRVLAEQKSFLWEKPPAK